MGITARTGLICAAFVCATLGSAAVRAEPARGAADDAKRHFEDGSKHYHLGEFKEAAEEYKAAYKAKPDPVFLYNIAQSYRLANDFGQALFFYRSYLTSTPDTANRAEIEERIRKLEAQVAAQKSLATAPPTDAVAPGGQPKSIEPSRTTTAPALGAAAPVGDSNVVVRREEPRRTPVYKKWWLWTIVGVAVAGVAVGVSVGVTAHPSATGAPSSHFGTVSF